MRSLLLGCFLLSGCASMPMTRTGFLEDYDRLQPLESAEVYGIPDGVEAFAEDLGGASYDSVHILPVVYRPSDEESYRPQNGAAERLARYFGRRLEKELGREFEVVDEPRSGTLIVRSAITAVHPSNVPLNIVSGILLFPFDMGGVSGEIEVLDAASGKQLAAMTLYREGTPFLFFECFNRHGHARHGLKKWAAVVRRVLED